MANLSGGSWVGQGQEPIMGREVRGRGRHLLLSDFNSTLGKRNYKTNSERFGSLRHEVVLEESCVLEGQGTMQQVRKAQYVNMYPCNERLHNGAAHMDWGFPRTSWIAQFEIHKSLNRFAREMMASCDDGPKVGCIMVLARSPALSKDTLLSDCR